MTYVLIKEGTYGAGSNARTIKNKTFPLVKDLSKDRFGQYYITVEGSTAKGLNDHNCRVKVKGRQAIEYTTVDGETLDIPHAMSAEQCLAHNESEEEAIERIGRVFRLLNEITDAAAQGIIKGMIVSGPPGIGKSYGVEDTLKRASLTTVINGEGVTFEVVRGASSPIGLYKKLYENRYPGFVTVFDDCDSILWDEQSLNLLKAALDTSKTRHMSWLAESHALKNEEIPNHFDFEGSIIFLTNLDFENTKASKLKAHLAAIVSRCHYLNLEINSERDQILRIKQIVGEGMLEDHELDDDTIQEIIDYVCENASDMKELSLRTVVKIADVAQAHQRGALTSHWRTISDLTMLKKEAYYKRLINSL